MLSITDPLIVVEGGILNLTCQAVSRSGISINPETIIIQKNDLVFSDALLSTSSNATHRLFNYGPLNRSVDGEMVQCSVGGVFSEIIPIQVHCKYNNWTVANMNLSTQLLYNVMCLDFQILRTIQQLLGQT